MARRDKDLDHEYRMRVVQAVSLGWQGLVKLGCVALVCTCIYFSVRELAGRQTWADVEFKVIADLKANKYFGLILPWGVAVLSSGWAVGERKLRQRHINRVSSETSVMQKLIDPGRRSSQLSKKGETNPEDY
jgi:hypothetical protein